MRYILEYIFQELRISFFYDITNYTSNIFI